MNEDPTRRMPIDEPPRRRGSGGGGGADRGGGRGGSGGGRGGAGGALGARAALAALEVLSDPDLLASVRELGAQLERACLEIDGIAAVRRRGLMVGLELEPGLDSREIAPAALAEGVVVNAPNPETIRLLPALVIDRETLLQGIGRLAAAVVASRRTPA